MRLFSIWFIFILFSFFLSCKQKPEIKIISRYENGKITQIHTYNNPSDTLSFLETEYYESGKISYQGSYVNKTKDGHWVWYFSNGILKDSATYHNGDFVGRRVHWDSLGHLTKLEIITGPCYDCCCDGEVVSYYPNGQIQSQTHMLRGKENGKYVYHFENGQPKKEQFYNDGIKEGNYYEWFGNGKKWVIGYYRQGKMDSLWTWFDSTGLVKSIQELKNGELIRDIK